MDSMDNPLAFVSSHFDDPEGNPAGGTTFGVGFAIGWQNGPLGRGEDRVPPNGAFVETVIMAAMDRLHYYQRSKFNCKENADALQHLDDALRALNKRTRRREYEETEGTHNGN